MGGAVRLYSALTTLLLSAVLYSRSGILYTFYANAPGRFQHHNELNGFKVRFPDLIRNCEDVYLDEKDGFALLSCDPGRDEWNTVMGNFVNSAQPPETGIYLYQYSKGLDTKPRKLKLEPSSPLDFHPLGIEYHAPSKTLFVANHASSGSKIDLYALDVEEGRATLTNSVKDSRIAAPNSIAATSGTEFYVSNDHYFLAKDNPALSKLETYAGIPFASVAHVKIPGTGSPQITTLTRMAFPNGVVFLNTTTLAVASCSGANVHLYTITPPTSADGAPKLTSLRKIPLAFIPDNLSVDGKGTLLIAGHPHAPSLELVSENNRFCNKPGNESLERCKLPRLSYVSEWSESGGLKTLYTGDEYGTSTTAVRDVTRGVGFVAGLYERGLLTWKA